MRTKKIGVVLLIILTIGLLAGCGSDKNSVSGKGRYIEFLEEQFATISESLTHIKTALGSFSEEQLSDKKWVDNVKEKLDTLDKATSNLVSQDTVPDDFVEINNKLKEVANQLKIATESYRAGIEKKDFSILRTANTQMQAAATAMETPLGDLQKLIESFQ